MNSTAYLLLAAMIVVPQFILVHPYLHLLIMAPLLVWIGCQNSLAESAKAPGDSQAQNPVALSVHQPILLYHRRVSPALP